MSLNRVINNKNAAFSKAHTSGWESVFEKPHDLKEPCAFYLFEPLNSGHKAVGLFDIKDLKNLVSGKAANKKEMSTFDASFGTINQQFYDGLNRVNNPSDSFLPFLIESHIVNYSQTDTAKQAIAANCVAFGAIVYINHNLPAERRLVVRPIAIGGNSRILTPGQVAHSMLTYLEFDYSKSPELFSGHNLHDLIKKHSEW